MSKLYSIFIPAVVVFAACKLYGTSRTTALILSGLAGVAGLASTTAFDRAKQIGTEPPPSNTIP